MSLFIENVSWHLKLKADIEFFTITGKSNTGLRRFTKNRICVFLQIYSSQGSCTALGLTHCMLFNIFIFTDKYELGTYYWSCPTDQELSLRNKLDCQSSHKSIVMESSQKIPLPLCSSCLYHVLAGQPFVCVCVSPGPQIPKLLHSQSPTALPGC